MWKKAAELISKRTRTTVAPGIWGTLEPMKSLVGGNPLHPVQGQEHPAGLARALSIHLLGRGRKLTLIDRPTESGEGAVSQTPTGGFYQEKEH